MTVARRRRSGRDRRSSTSARRSPTGLHQVDNPVFDRDGNLYVTYSGTRGQQVPVSIFRVRAERHARDVLLGHRQPDVDGDRSAGPALRLEPVRGHGLPRGRRRIGRAVRDRSRRRLRARVRARRHAVRRRSIGHDLSRRPRRPRGTFATLPASVAAFHLAIGPDLALYVTGPTLVVVRLAVPHRCRRHGDHAIRRASAGRRGSHSTVADRCTSSRRSPDRAGSIACRRKGEPELVLAGPGLVGVAFDGRGGLVVASNETAYRLTAAGVS